VDVTGCVEVREFARRIAQAEVADRDQTGAALSGSRGGRSHAAQSEDDLLADERLARRLQAAEEGGGGGGGGAASQLGPALLELLGGGDSGPSSGSRTGQSLRALQRLFRAREAASAASRAQTDGTTDEVVGERAPGDEGPPGVPVPEGQDGAQARIADAELARVFMSLVDFARGQGGARATTDGTAPPWDPQSLRGLGTSDAGALLPEGLRGPMMVLLLNGLMEQRGVVKEALENRTVILTLGESAVSEGVSPDHRQCMVCLDAFQAGDEVRILPCLHRYHRKCADPWLEVNRHCPVCKHDVTQ